MASYRIRLKASAAKEIEKVEPLRLRRQVVDRIRQLSEDPRPIGCEKLSGHANRYRVRQGSYRIVYSIADEILTVFVVKVAHRSVVYRDL